MGLTTLLLISVFFLDRSHNTHRWIHAGGFSLQPSELAKPVLILFLAYFLESRAKTMDDVRNTLLPAAAPVVVFPGIDCVAARSGHGHCVRRESRLASCMWLDADASILATRLRASLMPLYFLIFHVSFRRDRILAF